MLLSDISVKRPVLAVVLNLLIIAFGILAFSKLPLREYPDIDPPVVSITTAYAGASASVIESRVTQIIEDRIAGIEGIQSISSESKDGESLITIEFVIDRNIDDAANDIRDRVSGVLDELPVEADPPDIQKTNADDQVILWLNLQSKDRNIMELTDYAKRYLEDRFSALDGVARVRIGGAQEKAMRIWIDRNKLAARNLSVSDVERVLRAENIELPAGYLESQKRDVTLRVERSYRSAEDFDKLVLDQGADGYLVRLGEVARIEIGPVEPRSLLRGNGVAMVGIGITKQSTANTLAVAELAKAEMASINETLPEGMSMAQSYDTSVFIDRAIHEVYLTLFIAVALVILIMYLFLGNWRATLVPAVTVPVSLVGTFIFLFAFGFTINLLTLLALVLAIGLVVDDAIVVIENIYRRMELGESRMVAAYRGTRQVGFAVIATTLVLVAVFIPLMFLDGDIGRLFIEFAVTMSAAVMFSCFVALTFSPMLSSQILAPIGTTGTFTQRIDALFDQLQHRYHALLVSFIPHPRASIAALVIIVASCGWLAHIIPSEFAPTEDRGAFFVTIRGPEGASYQYMREHLDEVEKRLMPMVETGEIDRLLMRMPGTFGGGQSFNTAAGIVVLSDWETGRKPIDYYMNEVKRLTADMAGVKIFTVVRQAFGSPEGKPVQFVLGGSTYEELVAWRDIILEEARKNPNLLALDSDFFETKPQIAITVDRNRAGVLGVAVEEINRTLETLMGSRRVTTYTDRGEEYDVLIESEKSLKQTPQDLINVYVRSQRSDQLIPLSNLVTIREFADANSLKRYNRLRAITIESNLAEGYALGEALSYLENLVREKLPDGPVIDYKGPSLDYQESGASVYLMFGLALLVVYLVLAGQFESFIHPFIILLTVPMAMSGALFTLYLTGQTLNIYSQIGLIILIGIAAKNGILIVEFANQLRDEGVVFTEAIIEASLKRLRPILMTALTTAMGATPLIISTGAGYETRLVIGIVILSGVLIATFLTLLIVPVMYHALARHTKPRESTARRLEQELRG